MPLTTVVSVTTDLVEGTRLVEPGGGEDAGPVRPRRARRRAAV